MTEYEVARMSEKEARAHLESLVWPDGPVCSHCDNKDNIYELNGKGHRPGLYMCSACRKQFTVTVGTIMEASHIPLSKWILAFHKMCSSKKGISAKQLQRELGFGSYRTALFMCNRIRYAMENDPVLGGKFEGTVEVDETYVGGKPRKGTGTKSKRGRGTKKTPVLVLVERESGRAHARPVENVNAKTLKGAIREIVDREATIYTDEWPAYNGLGREYAGHYTIKHAVGEFSRAGVNVNSAESYFALLKRGIVGTFHHVSKQHLHRYCSEFSFRWSFRESQGYDDSQRRDVALSQVTGKRLMYKAIADNRWQADS